MKKKNRNNDVLETALYWQKKYLELQADCKDLYSVVVNLCRERGTEKQPVMLQFNEPNGYPHEVLEMLRESGIWELRGQLLEKQEELRKKREEDFLNRNRDKLTPYNPDEKPTDKDDKPTGGEHTITIPVKAEIDATYWTAYRAEIAKEIAVKVANGNSVKDTKIAEYAVDFATKVAEVLVKTEKSFNDMIEWSHLRLFDWLEDTKPVSEESVKRLNKVVKKLNKTLERK